MTRLSLKSERIGGEDKTFGFGSNAHALRHKALDEAERRAIHFLRGRDVTQRALADHWAVGLIDFAVREGREPGADEEGRVIGKVRTNDVDVRDLAGPLGVRFRTLRAAMHETAERKLKVA